MKYVVSVVAAFVPTFVQAHETTLLHVHPHGSDLILVAAFAVAGVAALALWASKRR